MRDPVVSVVITAYGGGWSWLARALDALRRNTERYEVILVDNGGARDRSVPDDMRVEIIRNEANLGFGPGSNQGAAKARADVICFLNPDAFVEPGWLAPMLEQLADDRVGAVASMKLNVDGSLEEAGAFVTAEAHAYVFGDGDDPDAPEHNFVREVDFGSAACLGVRRQAFVAAGGFDPRYRIIYHEDADLCFRLREEGLRVVFEPRSRVTHVRTVSSDATTVAELYSANREVFLSRWKPVIEQRPRLEQLQKDARLRLVARDAHAHDRVLLLDGSGPVVQHLAADIATENPRTRVTLVTQEIDVWHECTLLAAGVEVVSDVREDDWLVERSGHYSHVLAEQDARWLRLRAVLQETQPQALFVDATRLDAAARREPLAGLTSSLGIAG